MVSMPWTAANYWAISQVHSQAAENTEVVAERVQRTEPFFALQPFWQTALPNPQRLVIHDHFDLQR